MTLDATQKVEHKVDFRVELTQADNTSESATMVDVTAWATSQGRQVAECQGNLIKREMMRNPEMFPYLMELTQELEEVAKEYGIFHSDLNGTMTANVIVEYFDKSAFFHENDYRYYRETREVKEHPCNRGWFLYLNTLTVDEGYRRCHIGQRLVRRVLEIALRDASDAGRPLIAGVRPGFLGNEAKETVTDSNGEGKAVSVRFWRAMGFERYSFGFQPDLFFWGAPKRLPDETLPNPSKSNVS